MLQKTYFAKDMEELNSILDEVSGMEEYINARSVLAEIFANYLPLDFMQESLSLIRGKLPKACTAGISVISSTGWLDSVGLGISLCFFAESDVKVTCFSSTEIPEEEAVRRLKEEIASTEDVKAVLIFPVGTEYDYLNIIQKLSDGNEAVVFFGSTATVRFAEIISEEQTFKDLNGALLLANDIDGNQTTYTYSIGDSVIESGIVAAVISGRSLHIRSAYVLGWRPLGKGMKVNSSLDLDNEYVRIDEIDGRPAVDIFKRYLDVEPDEYFLDNVCEFPILIKKYGTTVGRVPYYPGEKGELVFSRGIEEGDEVRLSFAHPEELIKTAEMLSDEIKEYGPEALFLTICFNRYHFLKRDEHKEYGAFGRFFPELSLCYGGNEILRHLGQGTVFNSALVAVAMREGGEAYVQDNIEFFPPKKKSSGNSPTYQRLLKFIGASTRELNEARETAEKNSREKSVFLSDMSHEIRTKLNAIMGMNEMIIRESSNERVLNYADDIRKAGNSLLLTINRAFNLMEGSGANKEAYLHEIHDHREAFTAPEANILVVDDIEMNHNVIRNLLKRTKIGVDAVFGGRECLDITSGTKYDVILMDHRMPEMDGVETFKRLKENTEGLNHSTPVIAVTANTFTNSRETYLEMGFCDYISKPVDPVKLEEALLKYLPQEKILRGDWNEEEDRDDDRGLPEAITSSAVIDEDMGIMNCGSLEYFMETVRIYLDAAPDNRELIKDYFDKGDLLNYTTKVHALKSSSRIIGVKSLGDLAERLEKAGNDGDIEFIRKETPGLLAMYSDLTDVLEEAVTAYYKLDEEPEEDLEEITPDRLKEAYSAIRETAQMFDYDSMSMLMGMLEKFRIPDEEKERFGKLKKAFRDADWDEINDVLG